MKSLPIVLILIVFFLSILGIFIGGTFIFIAMQVYHEVYLYGGAWLAILATMAMTVVISYTVFAIIKYKFLKTVTKAAPTKSDWLGILIHNKTLISVVLFEVLQLFFTNKKNRKLYEK